MPSLRVRAYAAVAVAVGALVAGLLAATASNLLRSEAEPCFEFLPHELESLLVSLAGAAPGSLLAATSSKSGGALLRLNDWAEPAAWAFAVITAGLGLLLILDRPDGAFHGGRIAAGMFWLGMGMVFAGGARSGLIVDEHGITVQGWVRRRRWRWSEVTRFELKVPLLRQALRIYLASGKQVSTLGFGARSASERGLAEARVAELNRRAHEHRRLPLSMDAQPNAGHDEPQVPGGDLRNTS